MPGFSTAFALQAIVPASGTSLFADLWVVPQGAQGGNLQVCKQLN
jgi:spermidine/putrescine-binding protein